MAPETCRRSWLGLAIAICGCASQPLLPERAPGLQERVESASGMLEREYPDWATALGPARGRVVGLLMPAQSRWGRSLQGIGAGVAANPDAYLGASGASERGYELYAKGLSPRVLRFDGEPMGPAKRQAPGGLGAEAHLAEVEIGGGFGSALPGTFEVPVTGVRVLDGQAGYPRDAVRLLDSARAVFDGFLRAQAPTTDALLDAEAAATPAAEPRERVTDVLFPYWDDEHRRLVVLFHRRVMRMVRYSIPCEFVYEGMPPDQRSMEIRSGYGVELGQRLELDGTGALSAVVSFEPALLRVPSNAPREGPTPKGLPACPGSPGVQRDRPRLTPPEESVGRQESPAPVSRSCGDGERGWSGSRREECDGDDLGGRTCQSLGYLGGRPGCTEDCRIDLAPCEPTAGPPARLVPRAFEGDSAALALDARGRLLAVASRGPTIEVGFFDPGSLAPVGAGPAWSLPKTAGYSVGEVRVVAAGEGALIAATAHGRALTTLLLRCSAEGVLTGPVASIPGRVAFLVTGADHALLGVLRDTQLEVVRVDRSGALAGAPVSAISLVPGTSHAVASAARSGDGWTVAAGNGGNPFAPSLRYARVAPGGEVASRAEVRIAAGQVDLVSGEGRTFIVHTHPGALLATEVLDSGAHAPPRAIASGLFPRLVAAGLEAGVLVAWAPGGPGLHRLELDLRTGAQRRTVVLGLPVYVPRASAVTGGELRHLFQAAPNRDVQPDRALWLYSEPLQDAKPDR